MTLARFIFFHKGIDTYFDRSGAKPVPNTLFNGFQSCPTSLRCKARLTLTASPGNQNPLALPAHHRQTGFGIWEKGFDGLAIQLELHSAAHVPGLSIIDCEMPFTQEVGESLF